MAGYNTGTTATLTNSATPSKTFTIPAGVLNGDVVLVLFMCFTTATGTIVPALSSTATAPVPVGAPQTASGGGIQVTSQVFSIAATGSDAGATLTASTSGGTGGSYWFNIGLVAYTGFTGVDVNLGAEFFSASSNGTTTTPATSTAQNNDWQVQLLGVGPPTSNVATTPGGLTLRQSVNGTNAGLTLYIADSNGSVGAAGSSIGNTTWTYSGGSAGQTWSTSFTVGLKVPGAPPATALATPPRIPHPLWPQLLEVAQSRADWQAQGVASVVQQHWRLMDGVNGRPGVSSTGAQPPATGTASGVDMTHGLSFYTTQGGTYFEGYWYWCAASGMSTAPRKFALWSTINFTGGGVVVSGSAVTSGTLTPGAWNFVPLPVPIPISLYGVYVAAVGVPGGSGYPDTANQFGSGQPYSGGIASGPLRAFSDLGAGNPSPGNFGQSASSTAGANPAVNLPTGSLGAHDLLWLDVQLTNVPPPGDARPRRLWPNMADADFATSGDAAVNYVVGTKVIFKEPMVVTAIGYYVPGGMGASNQFATSASLWRVRDQVRVAVQQAPVWVSPFTGQPDPGGNNNGRWAMTGLPGVATVPAGEYVATVYNSNATPNGWSAKRLGYWQPYNQAADGTYLHAAPGAAGIENDCMLAPTTPAASSSTDYLQPSVTEPGQSVFAVGPPEAFPALYVGTPTPLFQGYWVDVWAVPARLYQPDAPDLPQRIPTPLIYDLLEVASYRRESAAVPVPSAAHLSSSPLLTAAALVTERASAAFTAPGTLTAAARDTALAVAHFTAPGSLSASAVITRLGSGALAAPGILGAAAVLTRLGSSALTAPGHLTAAGIRAVVAAAHLTAPAALGATGTRVVPGPAHLTAPGQLTATAASTLSGHASLSAPALLTASASAAQSGQGSQPTLDDLWVAYLAAQQVAIAKAQQWRMMRQAGGTDGSAGFLYAQAYEAEMAADKAYEAWRVAQALAFGGSARG